MDGNAQDGPKNTYYILKISEGTPPQKSGRGRGTGVLIFDNFFNENPDLVCQKSMLDGATDFLWKM